MNERRCTLPVMHPDIDVSGKRIAALPVKKVFPAHHSLDIQPEILTRMCEAFRDLEAKGRLHHGSGTFRYGDWGVRL